MRCSTLLTLALTALGVAHAAPTRTAKRTVYPVPTNNVLLLVQDSATNVIAYTTSAGFGYQWRYENVQGEGRTMPPGGTYTATIVPGSTSPAGDSLELTLVSNDSGETCRVTGGFLACYKGVDSSAPVATLAATFGADPAFPEGDGKWYVEGVGAGKFSVADAHEDDVGDGYLHMFLGEAAGRQSVSVYLASA